MKSLPDPAYWLRQFIFNELKEYSVADVAVVTGQGINPIIPSSTPSALADFYETLKAETELSDPLVIQYDKLMRFRTNPFYRIKKEQLVLTVLNGDTDIVLNVASIIEQLLDREDAAGQDINAFSQSLSTEEKPFNVFFHKARTYKVDESRDLLELASVNLAFASNKLIIEYDYHSKDLAADSLYQ
jgi:hypothetical protein